MRPPTMAGPMRCAAPLDLRERWRAQVYAEEGARALWRGAAARALWLTPGCAITITVFEAVERLLG